MPEHTRSEVGYDSDIGDDGQDEGDTDPVRQRNPPLFVPSLVRAGAMAGRATSFLRRFGLAAGIDSDRAGGPGSPPGVDPNVLAVGSWRGNTLFTALFLLGGRYSSNSRQFYQFSVYVTGLYPCLFSMPSPLERSTSS